MPSSWETSIARIFSKSGEVVGAGFLIEKETQLLVLTCAHVVAKALTGTVYCEAEKPEGKVTLDFGGSSERGKRYQAIILDWSPQSNKGTPEREDEDIAILKLEEPDRLPGQIKPIQLSETSGVSSHMFITFGFPIHADNGRSSKGDFGIQRPDTRWVELLDDERSPIENGFSGSLVWDKESDKGAGMVVAFDECPRKDGTIDKVAFMIPASTLLKRVRGDQNHYNNISSAFNAGKLMILVGASHESDFINHLSTYYAEVQQGNSLAQISQNLTLKLKEDRLHQEIDTAIDKFKPLDRNAPKPYLLLAQMFREVKEQRDDVLPPQLIITTAADSIFENLLAQYNVPFELVFYRQYENQPGRLYHLTPGKEEHLIELANEYLRLSPETQTIVLKLQGTKMAQNSRFLLTEDDYTDYLSTGVFNALPRCLIESLKSRKMLCLGYSPQNWHLRGILRLLARLRGPHRQENETWVAQDGLDEIQEQYWKKLKVKTLFSNLEEFFTDLKKHTLPM